MTEDREPWEDALRQGLDAIADPGAEEPPNVAGLQMLVAQVQREQRRATLRDLALFWGCALVLLTAGLYAFSRQPGYFVALQGLAAVGLLAAAVLYLAQRKRVEEP
jgi:Na+/H+ antiporter NhaD/arsenite permease-like protein